MNKHIYNKKAFTMVELLFTLLITVILLVIIFTLLGRITKLNAEVADEGHENAYTVILLSDIETIVKGCDYVDTDPSGNKLIIHNGSEMHLIDTNDYGLSAVFHVDNSNHTISVHVGGEEFCVNYVQDEIS